MIDLLIGSVSAFVLLVVLLIPAFRRRRLVRAAERTSARSGLAITPGLLPVLIRRRRATWIGYAIGSAIGFETTALLQYEAHVFDGGAVGVFARQSSYLLVGGLGALLGGAVGARSVRVHGARVARDRAVTIADYVEPLERRGAWSAGAIGGAVALVPLLHDASGRAAAAAIATGLAAVASVVVAELVARWIVSRPQRADSAAGLAWDDALRSDSVRNLVMGSGAIALGTLLASMPAALVAVGVTARTNDLQWWTWTAVVAILLVCAIRSMRRRPTRYFLRRLWPATAAQLAEHERPMEVQP